MAKKRCVEMRVRISKLDGVSRQEILQRLSEIQGAPRAVALLVIVHDNTSTRWGCAVPKEGLVHQAWR